MLQGTHPIAQLGWEQVLPPNFFHQKLNYEKFPNARWSAINQSVLYVLLWPVEPGPIWVVLLTNGKLSLKGSEGWATEPQNCCALPVCLRHFGLYRTLLLSFYFYFNLNFSHNGRARGWKKCSKCIWNGHGILHRAELPKIATKQTALKNLKWQTLLVLEEWFLRAVFTVASLEGREHVFLHNRKEDMCHHTARQLMGPGCSIMYAYHSGTAVLYVQMLL